MGSWVSVLEGVSPGIGAQPVDVRATPFLIFARWRFHERFQSFFGGGVSVHVYVESFQSRLQRRYAGFGSANLGVVFRGHELGDNGCRQNAEDNDDHHDLDQGAGARQPRQRLSANLAYAVIHASSVGAGGPPLWGRETGQDHNTWGWTGM